MISACLPCTKLKIVRFQNLCMTVRLEFLTSLFSNAKTSRGYTNNRPLRTKTRSFGRRKWWRCGFVSLFTFHCFITTCANLLFRIITYYLRYLDPINYLLNLLLVANRYLFKKLYFNLCGASVIVLSLWDHMLLWDSRWIEDLAPTHRSEVYVGPVFTLSTCA